MTKLFLFSKNGKCTCGISCNKFCYDNRKRYCLKEYYKNYVGTDDLIMVQDRKFGFSSLSKFVEDNFEYNAIYTGGNKRVVLSRKDGDLLVKSQIDWKYIIENKNMNFWNDMINKLPRSEKITGTVPERTDDAIVFKKCENPNMKFLDKEVQSSLEYKMCHIARKSLPYRLDFNFNLEVPDMLLFTNSIEGDFDKNYIPELECINWCRKNLDYHSWFYTSLTESDLSLFFYNREDAIRVKLEF